MQSHRRNKAANPFQEGGPLKTSTTREKPFFFQHLGTPTFLLAPYPGTLKEDFPEARLLPDINPAVIAAIQGEKTRASSQMIVSNS